MYLLSLFLLQQSLLAAPIDLMPGFLATAFLSNVGKVDKSVVYPLFFHPIPDAVPAVTAEHQISDILHFKASSSEYPRSSRELDQVHSDEHRLGNFDNHAPKFEEFINFLDEHDLLGSDDNELQVLYNEWLRRRRSLKPSLFQMPNNIDYENIKSTPNENDRILNLRNHDTVVKSTPVDSKGTLRFIEQPPANSQPNPVLNHMHFPNNIEYKG